MSNYPTGFDDDSTLPAVNDNLTEIGGDAINALRDAVFQIETTLGLNIAGTQPDLAARLGVFINPDGTPNASVITSLGLVTLPIRNDQIAEAAGIPESKLHLDFRTQDLFNYVRDLSLDVNTAIGWIATEGVKLEPHLIGAIYRHTMDQIDVSNVASQFLKNKLRLLRDNSQSYALVKDINDELLAHQWADGSAFGPNNTVTTNNGSVYSTYFAHVASGIFLDPSRFSTIPQTKDNLQLFAEYIDTASIFLLGTRIQNLYSAGISRVSRSSNLTIDGYGQFIVPPTPAIAFLENIGNSGFPFDDINSGDDIIQFVPSAANLSSFYFASQFALVKPGDIVRVHYADGYDIMVPYLIREKKYNAASNTFIIRIVGKNQAYSPNAIARIDRPLFNNNKYGELAISPVNNQFAGIPSLIINNPRGAQALGLGFNPEEFDEKHYNLYLALYPTGFAQDGYTILPAIDVTGNQGTTPGSYTLESIIQATNNAFRAPGYNYRFTAFEFQGNFGICLADPYGNAGFSILSAVVAPGGTIDALSTSLNFPNNVLDLIPTVGTVAPDPLGIGPTGSGVASPPFMFTYGSSAASIQPAKMFIPLRRNNYYVNGSELERLAIPNTTTRLSTQAEDGYGDGYWVAQVANVSYPPGRTQTTYRIFQDLSITGLKIGKTIVVQSLGAGNLVDFGRFIIQSVSFNCAPDVYTDITVYDAVHAKGFQPPQNTTIQNPAFVKVYFCDDSVSFNAETATDFNVPTPSGQFKRYFEVYVNDVGSTFTQERGRLTVSGGNVLVNSGSVTLYGYVQLNKLDIVTISPKLRGYQFGSVNKITLNMTSFVSATGVFTGYLASYDGVTFTHAGPTTSGKVGEVIRFYDETNTDFIEVKFPTTAALSDFSNQVIDFQLFPSLQLDDEVMFIGTCQLNDSTQVVSKIVDRRQFGNTGLKDLGTAVFDYLSVPEKYLHSNGIIRGFDIPSVDGIFSGGSRASINLAGGVVLVNGKIYDINNQTVIIPIVNEIYFSTHYPINWALCINDSGEYVTVPMLDFDSTLGNPNAPTRTFTAFDFVSSTSYVIPAVTFADLVNRRADLTILYIVSSTISGTPTAPIITLSVRDARKYEFKKDWGYVPTFNLDANNGDFRTFESLKNWFNFDSTYTNIIRLKGTFTSVPTSFTYNSRTRFMGDGSAIININNTPTISNIEFNYITFNITGSITLNSNTTFNNVTYTNTSGNTTVNSCSFKDTTFTGGAFSFSNCTFSGITFNFSSVGGSSFSNCSFTNCTFNFNFAGHSVSFTGVNSSVEYSVFNFGASSITLNLTSLFTNNRVNWNTISNNVNLSGNFDVTQNQFTSTNTFAISQFLNVADGSNGLISNNFFFRFTNVLTGYIIAPASYTSGTVSVVDNFFDSSTIDGSNQNLVKNLPAQWRYKNNLNTPATIYTNKTATGNGLIPYTVTLDDDVILLTPQAAMAVNLPQISLSPPGRRITIKDVTGVFDTNPVTLHRAVNTETIEGLAADYIYQIPFGSITLVAGTNGWVII